MHTVVEPWCIGCGLCLPPCPVDCIAMIPARGSWTQTHKQSAKERAARRRQRLDKSTFRREASKDPAAVIAAALARKKR
jgi:electron transport complex protein RnfB